MKKDRRYGDRRSFDYGVTIPEQRKEERREIEEEIKKCDTR